MRKTKIICTIGPASEKEEVLANIMNAGMSVSRHNFSHGDHAEHKIRIELVKSLAKKHKKPIAVMLDTKGPEIRTGNFAEGKVELAEGSTFTIYCNEEVSGDATKCSVTYAGLADDVTKGNMILIDDGLVGLEVQNVEGNKINCLVKNSGMVGNHKGVNVPGVSIKLPAITEKDIADLKFGVEVGVDLVAASFIRKASDVATIRKVLTENGGEDIMIFSKIENQEGVDNIDEIIAISDGIMVARGDLGVEIPIEKVPGAQKLMIEKCNKVGKPVITATQMLDSMIRNPRPTRAEASDVANAIYDGTDCIMLSGETANGKYPVEAVQTMAKIAETVEEDLDYERILSKKRKEHVPGIPTAISLSSAATAMELGAKAIIAATQSGSTAKMVSRYRPQCPVVAITPYDKVARRLALSWGVYPIIAEKQVNTDELINKSVEESLNAGFINKGDIVIITAGVAVNEVGSTNLMKVHEV
ncbi:pyruvate kinase [Clostridium frigidicarnis]|uniref:Pyruvate kinase n=1 Tax=Clostridium frigidicarnis TaxID=84698 RepID=A0A1I0Y7B2_9CLOT|nr:pyruvate kinase [Clostridium frigidicarnis]SFB08656.1 pyruvate kinase [Clostridium frigidicarnis]